MTSTTFPPNEMSEHIAVLTDQLGVRHVLVDNIDASHASLKMQYIATPPATTPEAYFTALHELGHIACNESGRHALERYLNYVSPTTMRHEGQAWLWAIEHHEGPFTKAELKDALRCLRSYKSGPSWPNSWSNTLLLRADIFRSGAPQPWFEGDRIPVEFELAERRLIELLDREGQP